MAVDPEHEKLDEMAARIRQAGGDAGKPADEMPLSGAGMAKASRTGFDFVATVAVCVALGWFIDREFGTGPWGFLVMMLIGFVTGIANVWRALGGYDQTVGLHKKNEGK